MDLHMFKMHAEAMHVALTDYDLEHIANLLSKVHRPTAEKMMRRYLYEWHIGMGDDFTKQNLGRQRANNWLENELENNL